VFFGLQHERGGNAFQPENLLSAMWMQFAQAITEEHQM